MRAQQQVEHIFRHEYGLLVASLLHRVGVEHLDAIEDAVQVAMLQALHAWTRDALPDNPSAWLYQVAYRQFLTDVRNAKRRRELLEEHIAHERVALEAQEAPATEEMDDSFLRMLFIACDDGIPLQSQLVFTLKTLCGFSTREIALRLFISEANVYKRFSRAKQFLQTKTDVMEALSSADMTLRLPIVHRVLYLMFTEGYLSSHPDNAIRLDLCAESTRLISLVAASQYGDVPESHALLALVYFHCARINTRQNEEGALLLLTQQDRSQWDKGYIEMAVAALDRSTVGNALSRYHLEASIVAEHCFAKSFASTNWQNIVKAYELLERIAPSPLHILNRAIAMAEWRGAEAGLKVLQKANIPTWLERSYHWHAVSADLQRRCGLTEEAEKSAKFAIQSAPTEHIQRLLRQRLLLSDPNQSSS